MRRLDERHLEFPVAGVRMLVRLLKRENIEVGRKHVGTLVKRMGIEALYCKPNTSRRHAKHKICAVSIAGHDDQSGKPGLGSGYELHPDGARLRVSDRGGRLG